MSEGTQFLIGKVLATEQHQDAIHIAVAPVVAAVFLAPAQTIGFVDEGHENVGPSDTPLGIVDPFLTSALKPGERFWMFLYPNTITALRHQWTHPAFGPQPPTHISNEDHIVKSRSWIAEHAARLGLTADVLMEDADYWLRYEEHKVQHGSERWRDNFSSTEFWHHYEIVTGKAVDEDKKASFYCCTC